MSQQGLLQQSVRDVTGTAYTWEGDWHALFTLDGIAEGPFNGRMLAWINGFLGTSYDNLPGAQAAMAAEAGASNWGSIGTIDLGGAGEAGGAALLTDETDGFAVDFTHAVDAERIAVKTAGVAVASGIDAFYANAGTFPKQVFNAAGALGWVPHNLFLNSAVPATQTVATLLAGETYTVTVTGSGSLTASVGGSGVATQASPLTFVASGTSVTFTLAGSLTVIQLNRGAVATAYLATTAAKRYGVAIDSELTGHISAMLVELAATNLLLNSTTLSTQSVTVTAVAYTLSFLGTGTVTLSGVSTAGPLVGTGAANRVTLNFTPTAGSLTLTVSGTVSDAQLETGSHASSPIKTFAASSTRAADNCTFPLSQIPALGAEYSIYARFSLVNTTANRYAAVLSDGTASELAGFLVNTVVRQNVTVAASPQASITGPAVTSNVVLAAAARFKANDMALSVNGAAVGTDLTATMPTVTETRYGGTGANTVASAYVRIEKLVIVPRAWSDAELQARSAS